MIAIVCVDDKLGLAFNHRRQSRDAVLCEDILTLAADAPLWMHPYSASLFPADRIHADESYLAHAGTNDYCFLERENLLPYADAVHTLVLYRWNRTYPADIYFSWDWDSYQNTETVSFRGKSHPDLVREIWKRK
jgi:hypothetical protein